MKKWIVNGRFGLAISSCLLILFVGQIFYVLSKQRPLFLSQKNYNFDPLSDGEPEISEISLLNLSHPLENSCKYPILHPDDLNIAGYVRHPRILICPKVQPEFSWIDEDGYLYIQEDASSPDKPKTPSCFYRPFGGSLKPHITTVEWLGEQRPLETTRPATKFWIPHDQFEVKCYRPKDKQKKKYTYRYAHAHIGDREDLSVSGVTESKLSLDILILDSISLNQFRRHMINSWPYMRDTMGFEWLEGYNKVADNSMVNLLPILAGLRYVNQSKDMPSDILPQTYNGTQLELESIEFIWDLMKKKGCVTMLNDAIGHHTRGLFHYPWKSAKGFVRKPTDYYFRPWYVSNYRWPVSNTSGSLCFGNHPLSQLHIGLMRQFMKKFSDKCHFSFNFLTALSHNDPNHIELLDENLREFLERMYTRNQLNSTVMVVLGDHGNRVSAIRYSYIGRFEERLPFLGIYLPKWFKKKHPELLRNLRINRHRLTSNFDLHQTLLDIANQRWSGEQKRSSGGRGRSLFEEIPAKRSCREAEIPEQYCTCLVKQGELIHFDSKLHTDIRRLLKEFFKLHSQSDGRCASLVKGDADKLIEIELLTSTRFAQSQMVRHGIRYQDEESLKELKKRVPMDIEYVEVIAKVRPFDLDVRARFQNEEKHPERLRLNVEPMILNPGEKCKFVKTFQDYCRLCEKEE